MNRPSAKVLNIISEMLRQKATCSHPKVETTLADNGFALHLILEEGGRWAAFLWDDTEGDNQEDWSWIDGSEPDLVIIRAVEASQDRWLQVTQEETYEERWVEIQNTIAILENALLKLRKLIDHENQTTC